MNENDLRRRLDRLERRSRLGWALALLLALPWLASMASRAPAGEVLTARGLVIEDAEGRPRIVLGAPIDGLEGRRRDDPAVGILVLDEAGEDRVCVGSPTTDPQMGGRVQRRIGPAAGINFNDRHGNERGGLGILDNDDRVVLGLDRAGGEGVMLFVMRDHSGLLVNGEEGGGEHQRVFLGTESKSSGTIFNLDDAEGTRRFQITVDPGAPPYLELYDDDGEALASLPGSEGD